MYVLLLLKEMYISDLLDYAINISIYVISYLLIKKLFHLVNITY